MRVSRTFKHLYVSCDCLNARLRFPSRLRSSSVFATLSSRLFKFFPPSVASLVDFSSDHSVVIVGRIKNYYSEKE